MSKCDLQKEQTGCRLENAFNNNIKQKSIPVMKTERRILLAHLPLLWIK